MSRNSRNVESAKNHISEFSLNSPFSSKLPFSFVLKIILWRIFAIFAIFVKLAIIVKIATLDGAPLPYHLTCSYYYGEFRHFHSFRQICHFRQNRQSQRGPLIIFNFTCSKGFGEFSSYSPFSSKSPLSNFSYRRRLDQLIQLYIS